MKEGFIGMSILPSRRRILATGAGAALGAGVFGASTASASASASASPDAAGPEETRSLDELYQAALAEGGKLVVYAGGDVSTQADGLRTGFKNRFPESI